jgi:hypothetical protein
MITRTRIFKVLITYGIIQVLFLLFKLDITIVINDSLSWWLIMSPTILMSVIIAGILAMLSSLKM